LLFHIVLVAFMLAASGLAWLHGSTLVIGFLPWKGLDLIHWVFYSGLAGLAVTALAAKRLVPALFLLWNVVVVFMLVRGYFFSSYGFGPGRSVSFALCFIAAALVAAIGSVCALRQPRVKRRKLM
jgi:hypothetical protein